MQSIASLHFASLLKPRLALLTVKASTWAGKNNSITRDATSSNLKSPENKSKRRSPSFVSSVSSEQQLPHKKKKHKNRNKNRVPAPVRGRALGDIFMLAPDGVEAKTRAKGAF